MRIQLGCLSVSIIQDTEPLNPRTEFTNVGTMVCWHPRYTLGDINPPVSPEEWLLSLMQDREYKLYHKFVPDSITNADLHAYIDKHYIMLPLYLYDHSGVSMSTAPFACPWDSGQVGYIYVDRTNTEYTDTLAGLIAEVETYNQYLNNDTYGYVIEDDYGDCLDSCWGFYGVDACIEEAKHIAEAYLTPSTISI
jgi:hypothetical protein